MNEEPVTQNSETLVETTTGATTESLLTPSASEEAVVELPAEEAVVEEVVPVTAEDFTFPEGVTVNEELRDEFLNLLNDSEMSLKDRAQALVDLQLKTATQAMEASSQLFDTQQKEWQDEVKKELGAKFQPTLAGITRLVNQYGTPEFLEIMAATGAGNNLHVIRMFDKIAQKLNEGGPALGTPVNTEGDRASRLFPSMKG